MTPRPPRAAILAAYAAIYLVWGSTFVATRWAVEGIPPFLTMGVRCLIAGAIMASVARLAGQRWPRGAALAAVPPLAFLFFVGCHGLLAVAQTRVDSGIAALIAATIPLWVPLIAWAAGGTPPRARALVGVALGIAGVAALALRGGAGRALAWTDAALLLAAALSWAAATVASVRWPRAGVAMAAGVNLVAGGAMLLAIALALGEFAQALASPPSSRALLGLAYITVFGTLVAFSAYVWLLSVEPPARVATYAFVNPVVALLVGWALAGEALDAATFAAASLIVGAVALIVTERRAA